MFWYHQRLAPLHAQQSTISSLHREPPQFPPETKTLLPSSIRARRRGRIHLNRYRTLPRGVIAIHLLQQQACCFPERLPHAPHLSVHGSLPKTEVKILMTTIMLRFSYQIILDPILKPCSRCASSRILGFCFVFSGWKAVESGNCILCCINKMTCYTLHVVWYRRMYESSTLQQLW